jgi:hypothetical protein
VKAKEQVHILKGRHHNCFCVSILIGEVWQLEEIKGRVVLLESYIERRGVILPPGFVQPKVLLVNRDCRYYD